MFHLASILVGGVLGAGIAMLMSPRSGDEYRRELRGRVQDRYGDVLERGRLRATELVHTAYERARTTLEPTGTTTSMGTSGQLGELGETAHHETGMGGSSTHQQY